MSLIHERAGLTNRLFHAKLYVNISLKRNSNKRYLLCPDIANGLISSTKKARPMQRKAVFSPEEVTYEGYGPAGTALIIECLTDNRNRTLGDVRLVLDRSGGNMANSGAVSWMFQRKAHFVVEGENADEEKLMDVVLDAGAEDIEVDEDTAEIWGAPESFEAISKALEAAGIATTEAGVTRKPDNLVGINELSVAQQVLRLIDKLEDLDDVQAVHSNADIASEVLDQISEED